jgi:hypothetical protein
MEDSVLSWAILTIASIYGILKFFKTILKEKENQYKD